MTVSASDVKPTTLKRLPLNLFASVVLAVIVGFVTHRYAGNQHQANIVAERFALLGQVFLRLISMVIAPLVFATVVSGLSGMDDSKATARIAIRTLIWFLMASLISLSVGLLLANLLHPGINVDITAAAHEATSKFEPVPVTASTFVVHMFPTSIVDAMANNEIIQILVFSYVFGIALSKVPGDAGRFLRTAVEGVIETMLGVTRYVMLLAPLGVFGALAATISISGLSVIATYAKLIAAFYCAIIILWIVLLSAGYAFLDRRVFGLLGIIREPLVIAFSTASSEAAYPSLIERLQRFGIPKRTVGLVLPLGYSFNLDGSMLYQAFAAVFIAQAFHVEMSIGRQLLMLLVLLVSSKGMAAIPAGSLVVVAAVTPMFGLPAAGILLILAIDQFLDMGRTATNVLGNSIAIAVVSGWESDIRSRTATPDS